MYSYQHQKSIVESTFDISPGFVWACTHKSTNKPSVNDWRTTNIKKPEKGADDKDTRQWRCERWK